MATRSVKELDWDRITVTVKLRSGELFADMDIAELGSEEPSIIAFWINGAVRVYPMDVVEYFELRGTRQSQGTK